MADFKKLIRSKGLSDIFLAASEILAILGLIGYYQTGITIFNPTLSSSVIAPLIVAIVFGALLCVIGSKAGKYIDYLLLLFVFLEYINSQITYVANILVAIDGSTLSSGFILTCLALFLAFVFALVSGILSKDEKSLLQSKDVLGEGEKK